MATFLGYEVANYILHCPVCDKTKDYYFLHICCDCRYEMGDDAHDEPTTYNNGVNND